MKARLHGEAPCKVSVQESMTCNKEKEKEGSLELVLLLELVLEHQLQSLVVPCGVFDRSRVRVRIPPLELLVFTLKGLDSRVYGFGLMVQGLGLRVEGLPVSRRSPWRPFRWQPRPWRRAPTCRRASPE